MQSQFVEDSISKLKHLILKNTNLKKKKTYKDKIIS